MRFAARQGRTRDVVASMTAWIDERRRMGRGVPVWSDPVKIGGTASALLSGGKLKGDVVNMRLMGLQSGLNHTAIYASGEARSRLSRAIENLGVEQGGMDTVVSIDPDTGLPWLASESTPLGAHATSAAALAFDAWTTFEPARAAETAE